MGRENIYKCTIGNESLHQKGNDKGVRTVNFATSKILVVKSTMFPHRNICKYTWTSPDGKTHNKIDYILVDRRRLSSILVVHCFRSPDCDTDHFLLEDFNTKLCREGTFKPTIANERLHQDSNDNGVRTVKSAI